MTTEPVLSVMQRHRFLRVTRALREGTVPYQRSVTFAIDVRGPVSATLLRDGLGRVVRAHEALRTGFVVAEGTDDVRPFVVPPDSVEVELTHADWTELTDQSELESRVGEHLQRLGSSPFDLMAPPLLRAHAVVVGPDRHILLMAVEHQVFDGHSAGIFMGELMSALADDGDLEPAPRYTAWAQDQHDFLLSDKGSRALEYWTTSLQGTSAYPDLGLPGGRPGAPPTAEEVRELDHECVTTLRDGAAKIRTTPFVLLLSAVASTWCEVSGLADAVIHSPNVNRSAAGSGRLLGWLANSMVLRVPGPEDDVDVDWVIGVRDRTRTSLAYQTVPFPTVIEAVQPAMHGTSTRQPRLYFNMLGPATKFTSNGIEMSFVPSTGSAGPADAGLTFTAAETSHGLRMTVTYRPAEVDAAFVSRLADDLMDHIAKVVEVVRPSAVTA